MNSDCAKMKMVMDPTSIAAMKFKLEISETTLFRSKTYLPMLARVHTSVTCR